MEEITIERTVSDSEFLPMITERDGVPVTTSRAVAEQFGKQHYHVLRDIENIIATLQETEEGRVFGQSNFGWSSYINAQNKEQPMIVITRDGFTLLAMGFTGAKAMQFKLAYINAFNRMEALLRGGGGADLQRRVEALEKAIAPRPVTLEPAPMDDLSASFLTAIQEAIDSGRYYIRPQYTHYEPDGMTPFGVYNGSDVYLLSMLAYDIYAKTVSNPLSFRDLWIALDMAGTIIPRKEVHRTRIIPGKDLNVIGLDRNRLRLPSMNRGKIHV